MGARLAQLGFQHVIGVDLSAAMLAQAERKNCYTQLVCNTYFAAEADAAAAPLSMRMAATNRAETKKSRRQRERISECTDPDLQCVYAQICVLLDGGERPPAPGPPHPRSARVRGLALKHRPGRNTHWCRSC